MIQQKSVQKGEERAIPSIKDRVSIKAGQKEHKYNI